MLTHRPFEESRTRATGRTAVLVGARIAGAVVDGRWYVDDGCAIAPRCLACPLPRCIEDLPYAERAAVRAAWVDRQNY
jgi:hypothetical protein